MDLLKRFIFSFAIGGLLTATGQIVMILGLHPAQLHALAFFLQGGAGLIVGTAFAISGLWGLADSYESLSARLGQLLGSKEMTEDLELSVKSDEDLKHQTSGFWRAYRNSAIAIGLFMIGILGFSITLSGADFSSYQLGLGGGVALWGLPAVILCTRSMGFLRHTHRTAETSIRLLDEQPEISFAPPAPLTERPATRWNRRRKRSDSRSLDPARRRRRRIASAAY